MNNKKVLIMNSNLLHNHKQLHLQVNFEESKENETNKNRKFPFHRNKTKKNLNKTEHLINNNDLMLSSSSDDHTEYYKSFLKSLNDSNNNENDVKYKSKTNEDKKKKHLKLKSNPMVKFKSSPNILNDKDKKKKIMFKKEKSHINLNNGLKLDNSSLIKKEKEEHLKKKYTQYNYNNIPLTLSSNYENLDDKTIQTDFKGIKDKNKKKNIFNYSNSDCLEKSQSQASSIFQNENINHINDVSKNKNLIDINKKIKINRRKESGNISDKKKNNQKNNKDNNTNINESKITYKKSNFLNVKKIEITNPRYRHSGKNLGNFNNTTTRKNDEVKIKEKQVETLSNTDNLIKDINNKENNKIIIPNKKKKVLFCCIPIN